MVASFTKSGHTSNFSGITEPERSFQGNLVDNGATKAIIPYTGGRQPSPLKKCQANSLVAKQVDADGGLVLKKM